MTTEPGSSDVRAPRGPVRCPARNRAAARRRVPDPARLRVLAMAAAVVAGLATWMIGEGTVTFFSPPPRPVKARGQVMNRPVFPVESPPSSRMRRLTFGVFGAGFSLAMGLAGGLGRRPRAAVSAAASGLLLGGTVASAVSVAVLPFYYRRLEVAQEALSHDLVLPFLVHAGIWSSVGASGGCRVRDRAGLEATARPRRLHGPHRRPPGLGHLRDHRGPARFPSDGPPSPWPGPGPRG